MLPGDRFENRRFGYPVAILGTQWRWGRRVIAFVTLSNRAIWRLGVDEFAARFKAA